jgi:hypothetical protein
VIVTVRNHHSNPARITLWQGTFNYLAQHTPAQSAQGRDSLALKATFHLAFRADIRQFRETIHLPPIEPFVVSSPFSMKPGSTASFSCSGTSTVYPPDTPNASDTYTWTGGGMAALDQQNPPTPPPPFFALDGVMSLSHTTLNLRLDLQPDQQCMRELYSVFPSPPGGSSDSKDPMLFAFPNFPTLPLNLSDPDAVIQPDKVDFTTQSCNGAGPPPNQCPASITWSRITPADAPDPNSPR